MRAHAFYFQASEVVGFVLLGLGESRYEAWVYLKLLTYIGLYRLLGPLTGEGASPE